MFGSSKGAYVSKNFMNNYVQKQQKLAQAKKDNKALSDSESDDEGNRSMCSVVANDLDNDLNYSGDEMNMNDLNAIPKAKKKEASKPGKVYR